MKDLFPGHFKETDENLKKVWEASLFVFDANIILNLYRYSDATRVEFLRILNKLKDQVWIPHRAAEEYLNNRLTVIGQQEKSYDDTIKSIESLQQNLDNTRQHPFVSRKIMTKVNRVFNEIRDELETNKSIHTNRINNDAIKDTIAKIFEHSVGFPYNKDRLEKLISEGEERYKQKIPPGFKDGAKVNDSDILSDKCRKYGDLIVWSQVIDKALEINKDILFVTDDKKEDWWEKFNGKTLGPRPELVKEFKEKTNQKFHMYQADRFLELAKEILGEKVSNEIVEEVREIRRRDRLEDRREREIEIYRKSKMRQMQLTQEIDINRHKMQKYEQEMHILQNKKHLLQNERINLKKIKNNAHEGDITYIDADHLTNRYHYISENYRDIMRQLDYLRIKRRELMERIAVLEQEIRD